MSKPPDRPDPALDLQITGSLNTQVQATLLREVEASQALHAELDTSHANSARLEGQSSNLVNAFSRQVTDFLALVAGRPSQDRLVAATKQMQETQMSFNLQYLQLQSQMQHENRSYTAVSNIMKTRHDTVKNSISNIR
jgi:hypothetical protein